ncbi:MAG: hypothetical protein AAFP81_08550 [Pseudomonadota bacterium]
MKPSLFSPRCFALAAVLSVGVAACSGDVEAPEIAVDAPPVSETVSSERAYFEQLLTAPFEAVSSGAEGPVDFEAAFADLPDGTRIETGAVSVVDATGATRVEDFAIVYDLDGTGVGLEAEEVLFYGLDPNAIPDRIRGTNLSASVKVADRIELRGVKSVGMDAVSKLFMDQYVDAIDDLTPIEDGVVAELNAIDVFNYNFEMDTLLLDGLVLEPFEFAEPAGAEDGMPSGMDAEERMGLQMIGAFARSFSLDALVYRGVNMDYTMRDPDIELKMEMSLGLSGMRDYQRGDLAYSGSWDTVFTGTFPIPEAADSNGPMQAVPMTGGIEVSTISGMKLARAFEALANWDMPDTSDTAFMDLGSWEMSNYTMDIAEQTLFESESFVLDTDFHWLLPTRFELSFSDTGYNLANLFEVMTQEVGDELAPGLTAEDLSRGLDIVEQYGFDCFCGDFSVNLNWDETSGDLTYNEKSQFAEAFGGRTFVDLTMPTPAEVADIVMQEDAEELFETAFKQAFEFRQAELSVTDMGGLTNLFEMLHAIGEAFPEQDGMAILAYNDAAQLRNLAVNSVIGMKPMVRQEAPMADPWMDAVASFLEEGGTLTFGAKPPQPIDAEFIESLDADGVEPEPEEIVEMFGLTVSHTK